jgi:CRISPR/Cas system CSM-associated protein Csm3 (group 7 of RAMP superfamily)
VKSYSHQVLVPAIVNLKLKEILPLMPEEIRNEDGKEKQDCEINAAKRLIPKLKQYDLPFILCGDAVFANQNIIELAQESDFSYVLTAKSKTLIERVKQSSKLRSKEVIVKNKKYFYEWLNEVSLNYNTKTIMVMEKNI